MDLPIVFDPEFAAGERDMPFRWDDEYGARFGVLRRDDPFGEFHGLRLAAEVSGHPVVNRHRRLAPYRRIAVWQVNAPCSDLNRYGLTWGSPRS